MRFYLTNNENSRQTKHQDFSTKNTWICDLYFGKLTNSLRHWKRPIEIVDFPNFKMVFISTSQTVSHSQRLNSNPGTRPGKHTKNDGKSPCSMGKSTINRLGHGWAMSQTEATLGIPRDHVWWGPSAGDCARPHISVDGSDVNIYQVLPPVKYP